MIDTFEIYQELKANLDPHTAETLTRILGRIHEDVRSSVTREDFIGLQAIVKELAEAQKRTEQKVEELAEAQKKTEQRLEALTLKVEELAEAQKKTEQRLEALANAQRKTEERIDILRERLEGVSNTFGYALEDITYTRLPALLEKEGIKVQGRIIRRYYERKGQYNQINIFGHITEQGKSKLLLGEVKSRPSKKEIDRFIKIAEHVKKQEGIMDAHLVFVAYDYHPHTEEYLKDKGIRYYWSYELSSER